MGVVAMSFAPFLNVSLPTLGNITFLAKIDLENNNLEEVFHLVYGNPALDVTNNSFSPPVSMYKALILALQDTWNATSLKDSIIHVRFQYCMSFDNITGYELNRFMAERNLTISGYNIPAISNKVGCSWALLDKIPVSANDYQPQVYGNIILRYLWIITITENNISGGCPPQTALIDAGTAESIWPGPMG